MGRVRDSENAIGEKESVHPPPSNWSTLALLIRALQIIAEDEWNQTASCSDQNFTAYSQRLLGLPARPRGNVFPAHNHGGPDASNK
jgi:hypothetical protein